MRENKVLHVYYGERLVGTMALTESKKAAFEYADGWDELFIAPKEICPMVRTWIIWMNWQKNVSVF